MNNKYDVIVIGAGLGGISTALRLRHQGFSVLVLEKNETYGGKLSQLEWEGYRWDKGPSLFTLPKQVEELFALFGQNPADFFDYTFLDDICHYYFNDGSHFLMRASEIDRNQDLVEFFGNEEGKKTINYIQETKKTYDAIGDLFIDHPKYGIQNVFDKALLKRYPMFASKKLAYSLNKYNASIFKDPRLVQLFNRYATYNGSDPYRMSGLYSMIAHLEMNIGAYFPKKGMRSIVSSLYDLAVRQGIDFKFSQEGITAKEIIKGNYEVATTIEKYTADKLVSAIDCVTFYKNVLKDEKLAQKYAKKEQSASAHVFYWAVEKVIPELCLHNIFFGKDYKEEFDAIFKGKSVSEAPTVYLHVSSIVNPEDAPANGQNWFVMINIAAGTVITPEHKDQLRTYVKQLIVTKFGIDITPYLLHEDSWDAMALAEYTGGFKGALYGAASNDKLAALTRHGNHSKKYKNLYFSGGTVHPGGGIPLVLKSAKIVAKLIEKGK